MAGRTSGSELQKTAKKFFYRSRQENQPDAALTCDEPEREGLK